VTALAQCVTTIVRYNNCEIHEIQLYGASLSENGLKVPLAPNFLATIASNKEKSHAWSPCSSSETFSRSLSPLMNEFPRPSQISDRRTDALIAKSNSSAYCPGSGHFRIFPPFFPFFVFA
jgi:hypothetical protein